MCSSKIGSTKLLSSNQIARYAKYKVDKARETQIIISLSRALFGRAACSPTRINFKFRAPRATAAVVRLRKAVRHTSPLTCTRPPDDRCSVAACERGPRARTRSVKYRWSAQRVARAHARIDKANLAIALAAVNCTCARKVRLDGSTKHSGPVSATTDWQLDARWYPAGGLLFAHYDIN